MKQGIIIFVLVVAGSLLFLFDNTAEVFLPLALPEDREVEEPDQFQPLTASDIQLAGPPSPSAVTQFVKTRYIHGVPYAEARQFGPEAVPILLNMLGNPANAPHATNIVVTLGFLGEAEARQPLLHYLTRTEGDVSLEQMRALMAAPFALGQLAYHGDSAALDFLLQASQPGYWAAHPLPWSYNGHKLEQALSRRVLLALGLTGAPQARIRLEELQAQPGPVVQSDGQTLALAMDYAHRVGQEGMDSIVTPKPEATHPRHSSDEMSSQAEDSHFLTSYTRVSTNKYHTLPANVNETWVDQVLGQATAIIKTADTAADVGCCYSMSRSGAMMTFTDTDGVIGPSEEDTVFYQPGMVKIVPALETCAYYYNPGITGCADSFGGVIIVEYLGNLLDDGHLWAHEVGHLMNLGHSSDPANIMSVGGGQGRNVLTQGQCYAFHNYSEHTDQPCYGRTFKVDHTLAAGEVLTASAQVKYVINLENLSGQDLSDMDLSVYAVGDNAAKQSYVYGSAVSQPPIDLSSFPNDLTFSMSNGTSLRITYTVQLAADLTEGTVERSIRLWGPGLYIVERHTAIMNARSVYLPLVIK